MPRLTSSIFTTTALAVINISEDGKGTGILIRSNIEYSNLVMNTNGRITSLVIDGVNFINIYAHSGSHYKKERELLFTDEILIHLGEFKDNVISMHTGKHLKVLYCRAVVVKIELVSRDIVKGALPQHRGVSH